MSLSQTSWLRGSELRSAATAMVAVVSFVCVLLMQGCSQQSVQESPVARPVKVDVVRSANWQSSETFVGTIRAKQRADLSFETGGRVDVIIDQPKARRLGVTSEDIAVSLGARFTGVDVSVLRHGDTLVPIVIRGSEGERQQSEDIPAHHAA